MKWPWVSRRALEEKAQYANDQAQLAFRLAGERNDLRNQLAGAQRQLVEVKEALSSMRKNRDDLGVELAKTRLARDLAQRELVRMVHLTGGG